MKKLNTGLGEVQELYGGPVGELWVLLMGEQIHAGGFASSQALAEAAQVRPGMKVADLCSAVGGGVRFLARIRGCECVGFDGTPRMIEISKKKVVEDGLADRSEFILADVSAIQGHDGAFDMVWGEDAWCYVADKDKLIANAARIVKQGGTIAFTDWIVSPTISEEEAARVCDFMKFPYMETTDGYKQLLARHGFDIQVCDELYDEFAGYVDLYIRMGTQQLTFDALRIVGWNMSLLEGMVKEFCFIHELAKQHKMGRVRIVGHKRQD
ncbi:MAG: methyltransferase domain-containing protein [Candidatus Brocadiia bacterium]